jgi:hypothetical protein
MNYSNSSTDLEEFFAITKENSAEFNWGYEFEYYDRPKDGVGVGHGFRYGYNSGCGSGYGFGYGYVQGEGFGGGEFYFRDLGAEDPDDPGSI